MTFCAFGCIILSCWISAFITGLNWIIRAFWPTIPWQWELHLYPYIYIYIYRLLLVVTIDYFRPKKVCTHLTNFNTNETRSLIDSANTPLINPCLCLRIGPIHEFSNEIELHPRDLFRIYYTIILSWNVAYNWKHASRAVDSPLQW